MSPSGAVQVPVSMGFPRVSGDEPGPRRLFEGLLGFSPRERG